MVYYYLTEEEPTQTIREPTLKEQAEGRANPSSDEIVRERVRLNRSRKNYDRARDILTCLQSANATFQFAENAVIVTIDNGQGISSCFGFQIEKE